MKLQHAALTNVGKVREENEDSLLSLPDIGTFLVADGMGGEAAGSEASSQVVKSVQQGATKFLTSGIPFGRDELKHMLRETLRQASKDVFDIAVRDTSKVGLGSTASLLCLHRGAYFAAQVGDSRIYLLRDGKVEQITRDHTVVWALYENGVITREQLETHPERHLLTQCMGAETGVEVDVFEGKLREGDLLMICSDGLTGYASEDDIFEILRQAGSDLNQCVRQLIDAALKGGGGDNVSVVVARVAKLEAEDDWEAVQAPLEKMRLPSAEEEPVVSAQPELKKKHQNNLRLLGAAVVVLVALGALFALTWPREIRVEITLASAEIARSAQIQITRLDGQPVLEAVGEIEGAVVALYLPRTDDYLLSLSAPDIVPIEAMQIYLSGSELDPIRIDTEPAGTLRLDISALHDLASIDLLTRNDELFYHWAVGDGDTVDPIKTEFLLGSGTNYSLRAKSRSGGDFERRISVDTGAVETVLIFF